MAIARKHMKGKHEGRSIPLHSEAKSTLAAWLIEMNPQGDVSPDTYLSPHAKDSIARSAAGRLAIFCGELMPRAS